MSLFERKAEPEVVLECPHDGKAMAKVVVETVVIDRCETCGGTWFDAKELRRVAHDRELEALATRIPIGKAHASSFACPRCGGSCIEGHVDEVQVDTCVACHGVWLDRGELLEAQRQLKADRLVRASPGLRTFLGRV
ncbi:MAG TPA: zf-TFIIB domain-containing protein [Candidatus Thermoplasmatota archaeon]|nr:zf-TFIIB domain-containing protein [Candidatus Thermoplasmatota archaeon]